MLSLALWQRKGTRNNLAEEDLVGVGPVDVGGVEEGDAAAESVRDDGDAGVVLDRGVVGAREAHAPEPQLRHLGCWIIRFDSVRDRAEDT